MMNGTIELITRRLQLRKHVMEDARILYKKFGCDPSMSKYSGWNPYASMKQATRTVREFIGRYQEQDFYGWAIEYDRQLIGTIGAYDYDKEKSCIEVGFSIERKSWEMGFSPEALSKVLEYLTAHEGIEAVSAWCASDNYGSSKAMEKAEMIQTDAERDAVEVNGQYYDKLNFKYGKCR